MKMTSALNKLKEAYYEVLESWETEIDLNELESIKKYPFEKSFDELGLVEWIEETIEELEGAKMKYREEFEEYLAELFDYNEDLILEYLYDEELYEEFLKQR